VRLHLEVPANNHRVSLITSRNNSSSNGNKLKNQNLLAPPLPLPKPVAKSPLTSLRPLPKPVAKVAEPVVLVPPPVLVPVPLVVRLSVASSSSAATLISNSSASWFNNSPICSSPFCSRSLPATPRLLPSLARTLISSCNFSVKNLRTTRVLCRLVHRLSLSQKMSAMPLNVYVIRSIIPAFI
jgi:hypothetical protein